MCLPHPTEPLLCYKLDSDGSRQLLKVVEDNRLLKCLGRWDLLKGNDFCKMVHIDNLSLSPSHPQGAVGSEKNWSQMRKQVYDNMSSYLARKEERLRVRAGQGISELAQEPDTETSAEPPDKKLRIDSNQ